MGTKYEHDNRVRQWLPPLGPSLSSLPSATGICAKGLAKRLRRCTSSVVSTARSLNTFRTHRRCKNTTFGTTQKPTSYSSARKPVSRLTSQSSVVVLRRFLPLRSSIAAKGRPAATMTTKHTASMVVSIPCKLCTALTQVRHCTTPDMVDVLVSRKYSLSSSPNFGPESRARSITP
jgi:hypothetical protein